MIKAVRIGKKLVGSDEKTYFIAEAGSNHDQKIYRAKKLIEIAASSGADAVKFQLFKADSLYPKDHPSHQLVKKSELPRQWIKNLINYAKSRNIEFLATPFDKEAVDILVEFKVAAMKWASSETVNLPLLRYAASKDTTIILSTGMSNIADIHEAIEVIKSTGNDNIILMQCTSLYPAKSEDLHLNVMQTLRQSFQLPVGLSDHSLGTLVPPIAVALGASIIEKHFTLNRKLRGPDHSYALEPSELKELIYNIRFTEKILGSPIKNILAQEKISARRESIYAKIDLSKHETITAENIFVRRPARGIEPRYLQTIIGLTLNKNLKKGSPFTWDILEY